MKTINIDKVLAATVKMVEKLKSIESLPTDDQVVDVLMSLEDDLGYIAVAAEDVVEDYHDKIDLEDATEDEGGASWN